MSGLSSAMALSLLAAAGGAGILFLNALTVNAGWWTVRLHVFRREHVYWAAVELALCGALALGAAQGTLSPWMMGLAAVAVAVVAHTALLPAWTDAGFRDAFWHAWTGRSRTRIQPALVPGLAASRTDVDAAAKTARVGGPERWLPLAPNPGIAADATEVLRELVKRGVAGVSREGCEVGTVFPSLEDSPSGGGHGRGLGGTSLLWGAPQFRRRVSRAIGALDGDEWARVARGGSVAHVLAWSALAHGVLGRNKGLNPTALVATGIGGAFEIASTLGPRPAKTKRGRVAAHMLAVYGLLGDDYARLATELALLLEDAGPARVCAWLGAECEHQDPALARAVPPAFGGVLYRLHYVAMLASLNFGDSSNYHRPELLVIKYLGPALFPDADAHGGWGWLEKHADRLDAERRANPGCEAWLKDVQSAAL